MKRSKLVNVGVVGGILFAIFLIAALLFKDKVMIAVNKQRWTKDVAQIEQHASQLGSFQFPMNFQPLAADKLFGTEFVIYGQKDAHLFLTALSISGLDEEFYPDVRHGWVDSYYTYAYKDIQNVQDETVVIGSTDVDITHREVVLDGIAMKQSIAIRESSKKKVLVVYTCKPDLCQEDLLKTFLANIQ